MTFLLLAILILGILTRFLSAFSVNVNTKPQLFPYQKEGVDRLVSDQRLLLADEMGLGKTVQCISAMNELCTEDDSVVLIVCPKSVLGVWQGELQTWSTVPLAVQVATPKSLPEPSPGTITLINYDICHKYRERLQEASYDILICDEAHYLKSIKAKRTLAILGDGKKHTGIASPYLWLLTGTPVLNRPIELFPLVRSLAPSDFSSFSDFADQYCDPKPARHRGRFSMDYSGASNLTELSQRLQPIMLRRYKTDVLTQLPPKFRSCLFLTDADASAAERDRLREVLSGEDHEYYSEASANLEEFGSDAANLASYLGKFAKNIDLDDPDNYNRVMGLLATIRKETAMTKLEPAVELLEDVILSEKVVVFCHHRDLILNLTQHFGDDRAVCVLGGMEPDERSEAVRRFQDDPNVRLFVGSIRAAGVGLTLTAASHVVFLELDWSPGVMSQAEDRCHRVGQRDSVNVQYYVFQDTIDEWIAKSLLWKQSNIDQILPDGSDAIETGYVFDFGKHKGLRLEDVPRNYLQFLVSREVWRNRPELWRALSIKGLVLEEPPQSEGEDEPETEDDSIVSLEVLEPIVALEDTQDDEPETATQYAESTPVSPISDNAEPTEVQPPSKSVVTATTSSREEKTVNRVQLLPKIPKNTKLASLDESAPVQPSPISEETTSISSPYNPNHSIGQPPLIIQKTDHPAVTILSPAPKKVPKKKPKVESSSPKDDATVVVDYTFDFGKHSGRKWHQVPPNYREWIVREGVWKNRENLKIALDKAGLVIGGNVDGGA